MGMAVHPLSCSLRPEVATDILKCKKIITRNPEM